MASAGLADGVSIKGLTYTGTAQTQLMEIMQAQLAEIGIDMSVESVDVGTATSTFFEDLGHDLYCAGWSGRPDPSQTTNSLFAADSFYNAGKYDSPGMAAALDEASATQDHDARADGLLGGHPPEPGGRSAPAAAPLARHHGGVRQHRRVHPEPLRQGRRLVPLARILSPRSSPRRAGIVTTTGASGTIDERDLLVAVG